MNKIIFLLAIIPCVIACESKKATNMLTKEIDSNWSFKEINGTHSGIATVPGTIHTDLLANSFIENPFYRINEKHQQWIDKKDWEYATIFNISNEEFNKSNIILDFKGLDTYADVYVNGSLVLQADNMFREWEVDIKFLASLGNNTLKVVLHSPIKKGLKLLENYYPLPAINDQSENGGIGNKKVSIFTRKAGYHYGWDWGPRLVTSGIWRPIVLKSWNQVRINNIFIAQPSVHKKEAQLIANIELNVDADFNGKLLVSNIETKEQYISEEVFVLKGISNISFPMTIQNPKLWWSQGLGEPNLYHFKIQLFDEEGNKMASKEITTGLRSLKLIREKDKIGESFLFELNGVRVFIKGANYIPNDNFVTRVTESDYKKVIKDAVDANMNMLRVWGGGIYEYDTFYELCDENGLLVWQDFMFACSMYPGNKEFLENVKHEAIDNVIRLRNHPSIALWCGNNEINAAWSHYSDGGWGWKEKYSVKQREEIQTTYLEIFHKILPEVVEEYTDEDAYWPSSPQAGFEPEKHAGYENTSGDMHYWGVWHAKHPFENFEKHKTRFMSEYGFQSFPDFETVTKYTLPEDYDIESEVMSSHQRSGIGNLRIKEYMGWDYYVPTDFEDFLYMSQVLQARGVKMGIEAHRRAMPYCMGTMYWQINDCWPVASWSSTDYYHKWKALHYAVKKAYEPILLTVKQNGNNIVINGVSDVLKDINGDLKLTLIDFNGNEISSNTKQVNLIQNTSTVLNEIGRNNYLGKVNSNHVVLKVEFFKGKKLLSNNLYYFSKPKDLQLEKPTIETEIIEKDGKVFLKVSTNTLVKDLYINFKKQKVFLSDNYFDLLANKHRLIEITSENKLDMSTLELKHLQNIK
tara:strand:+ start:19887 stop:22472 length:2586 start_codon:yes stop_codon:yes gene_type:complete